MIAESLLLTIIVAIIVAPILLYIIIFVVTRKFSGEKVEKIMEKVARRHEERMKNQQ